VSSWYGWYDRNALEVQLGDHCLYSSFPITKDFLNVKITGLDEAIQGGGCYSWKGTITDKRSELKSGRHHDGQYEGQLLDEE
jgi:hypothetical protein